MLFASFDFLLFALPVLTGYWLLGKRSGARLALVVLSSYFFYMASSRPAGGALPTPWYFVFLLIGSTLLDYVAGLRITSARERRSREQASEDQASEEQTSGGKYGRPGFLWLLLSLAGNLGLLGYFKYTGFLWEVTTTIAGWFGVATPSWSLHLLLPIGISFYTFQSLSYTIDVYRGRLTAERSLLRFAAYVAFFPQLVAGPIVRASEFLPQLRRRLTLTENDVSAALYRIGKGLLKKVLLGDYIAANLTDIVFASPTDYSSLENLVALYAFTLQIYADFSGYSDIAIGVARLMGFTLPENFDRPYQAVDVAEFWRRWHMTLSTWLRDYLFFPLGGSRVGEARAYLNLWVTMFLVGMWHGASWNFVFYANLQAAAMLFNRWRRRRSGTFLSQVVQSLGVATALAALGWGGMFAIGLGSFGLTFAGLVFGVAVVLSLLPDVALAPWLRPVHVLLMFHFSVLSRVFFRADTLESASSMVQRLLEFDGHGVRPGLFRVQPLLSWLEGMSPVVQRSLGVVAEYGLLVLLVLGLGYHFTPARLIDVPLRLAFRNAPAVVLACGFGLMLAVFSQLLSGPRANIYFAF